MGFSSVLAAHNFWTEEELMASLVYGAAAIRGDVRFAAVAGLALYLLLYSLLGAGVAAAIRDQLRPPRLILVSMLAALCWYFVVFRWAGRYVAPWVSRMHAPGPALWGHAIYGALLARYPLYMERLAAPPSVAEAPEPATPPRAAEASELAAEDRPPGL
jgi:hypothetical protein